MQQKAPKLCLPVVVLCTALSATVLTWLSSFGCWFLDVNATMLYQDLGLDIENNDGGGSATLGLGFWTRQKSVTDALCTKYNNEDIDITFDSSWMSGKYFSLLASILGLLTLFASCIVVFLNRPYWSKWMAGLNFLCCIFQSLAFTAYNSTICDMYGCRPSGGTSWGIAAAVLYFFLVVLHIVMARRDAAAALKEKEGGGDAEDDAYAKAERYAAMGRKEADVAVADEAAAETYDPEEGATQ